MEKKVCCLEGEKGRCVDCCLEREVGQDMMVVITLPKGFTTDEDIDAVLDNLVDISEKRGNPIERDDLRVFLMQEITLSEMRDPLNDEGLATQLCENADFMGVLPQTLIGDGE